MLKLLCFVVVVSLVAAHRNYLMLIPNGDNVPNPCGGTWIGVGHWAVNGGGERNPFGVDFAADGHTWTKALCEKDSDGDGATNGEELGDPQCTFTAVHGHTQPTLSSPTGHPGVCEPVGSSACSNQTFTC